METPLQKLINRLEELKQEDSNFYNINGINIAIHGAKLLLPEEKKEYEISSALNQFTGYKTGKWDRSIISLIEAMGLTNEEWIELKNNQDVDSILDEEDITEIENYFNYPPEE